MIRTDPQSMPPGWPERWWSALSIVVAVALLAAGWWLRSPLHTLPLQLPPDLNQRVVRGGLATAKPPRTTFMKVAVEALECAKAHSSASTATM